MTIARTTDIMRLKQEKYTQFTKDARHFVALRNLQFCLNRTAPDAYTALNTDIINQMTVTLLRPYIATTYPYTRHTSAKGTVSRPNKPQKP